MFTKKKSILIAIVYIAIAFGVIEYLNFFPPQVWTDKVVKGARVTLAGYYSNYEPFYLSIIIFGVGAILLLDIYIIKQIGKIIELVNNSLKTRPPRVINEKHMYSFSLNA